MGLSQVVPKGLLLSRILEWAVEPALSVVVSSIFVSPSGQRGVETALRGYVVLFFTELYWFACLRRNGCAFIHSFMFRGIVFELDV